MAPAIVILLGIIAFFVFKNSKHLEEIQQESRKELVEKNRQKFQEKLEKTYPNLISTRYESEVRGFHLNFMKWQDWWKNHEHLDAFDPDKFEKKVDASQIVNSIMDSHKGDKPFLEKLFKFRQLTYDFEVRAKKESRLTQMEVNFILYNFWLEVERSIPEVFEKFEAYGSGLNRYIEDYPR